ncbi:MAG: methyltransferase domain-containing protein [Candidatus Roizmanbacteria bacterium]|nr:methyltransferase domain-containing protein [Candidatus Roizmanbacteria bacterium]
MRASIDSLTRQFGNPKNLGRITPTEGLEIMDVQRIPVARARTKIVGNYIDRLGLEGKNILEIGSGTGDLYRLIKATGKHVDLSLSDIKPERVKSHIGNEIPVKRLDLNRLDLPDSSQEIIIVSNLLDQFEQFEPPLSEIQRVLTPGGILITLTDLAPDEFVFFKRHADSYILPFVQNQKNITSIPYVVMTAEQAEQFGNLQPPALKEFWFAYMDLKEPWERALVTRISHNQQIKALQHNMLMLHMQKGLGFEPKIIDSPAEFHIEVGKAMEKVGFENVDINLEREEIVGPPERRQKASMEYNHAFSKLIETSNPTLQSNVKEIAL